MRRTSYLLLTALFLVAPPSLCQDWLLVEGLIDGEAWETDSESRLLSRNEGTPSGFGRVRLWAVAQPTTTLQFVVFGEASSDVFHKDGQHQTDIEQGFVRYVLPSRSHVVLEAGKIATPVGTFSRRHFSDVNPLIGQPDSYDVSYPWGLQVSGSSPRFDYRIAAVSRPVANEKYVPPASSVFRPALGGGVTVMTGLRLGLSYTQGPYLSRNLDAMFPAGTDWRDQDQRVLGFDVQFSRGRLELQTELALSEYDVPTDSKPVDGLSYYIEAKYTWTPRIFGALRFEQNDYPFVRPISDTFWVARAVNFFDAEVGAGYRFGAQTVLKLSYRRDLWTPDEDLEPLFRNGHALALQISHRFDVLAWFQRRQ